MIRKKVTENTKFLQNADVGTPVEITWAKFNRALAVVGQRVYDWCELRFAGSPDSPQKEAYELSSFATAVFGGYC